MIFQNILEHSSISYAQVGIDKDTLYVNSALSSFTGYSKKELMSINFTDITHPDDIKKDVELFEQLLKGEIQEYRIEKRYIHKSGKIIWGDLFVTIIPNMKFNSEISILSSVVDITEKKENEAAIKKEEANFKAMFMNNPQAMGIYSSETFEIFEVNPALSILFGYSKEELLGMKSTELFTPEMAVNYIDFVSHDNSSLKNNRLWKMKTKSGEVRHIESVSHIINHKGQPARHVMLTDVTEREEALHRIRENEALLTQTEIIGGMASWEWDVLNNVTKWSKNMCHLYEVTSDEIVPSFDYLLSKVHPDDHVVISNAHQRLLKEKNKIVVEYRILQREEKVLWIQSSIEPYFRDNVLVYLKGINLDITGRKKDEFAIIKNRDFLRQSQVIAKMGSFEYDPYNETIIWSENLFRILKVDPSQADLSYNFLFSLVHPDDARKIMSSDDLKSASKEIRISEFRAILPTNEIIWIEMHFKPIYENNQLVKLRGAFIDITERKNSESALLNFNQIIEQSPASILITNTKGEIDYVNPGFTKITGYEKNEVIGKKPNIIKSNLTENTVYRDIWDAITSGRKWDGEMVNKQKSGNFYWESKIISPVLDKNGKTINYISIGYDITNRKMTERELIVAKDKAQESDRLKTAFLRNISHEIRTPMNGILGFSNLLHDYDIDVETRREYIEIINQSGQRLMNTVDDIIEVSKIEAGHLELEITGFSVKDVMEYSLIPFMSQATEKGLKLQLSEDQISGENDLIQTDRTKLDSILSILINNALKFTLKGSIQIGSYLEGSDLVFYVKDTGVGIPEDSVEMIFDRFMQADTNITRAQEGPGLGLSIAKAYVTALHGKIWVNSQVDKGSTFFFSIPYMPFVFDTTHENADDNFDQNSTILLVEDDELNFQYCETLLMKKGFNVLHAKNGEVAVEKMKEIPSISLILMDLKMPIMDGLESTRQIRKFNETVPIIAQTAFGFVSDKEDALDAGCNDYISKPINSKKLISLIQKHLTRTSQN